MTQSLMQTFTSGGGTKQLIARNSNLVTKPVVLDNAINAPVKRGCLVFGANADAATVFALVATGAMPAATDVILVVADDIDLTGAAADVKANAFVAGEFVEETVFAASSSDLTGGNKTTLREALLRQGIYLVNSAYGSNTETP